MADHYEVAGLSVDAVVTDALVHGTSPVSLKARERCDSAVARNTEKKATEAGEREPTYTCRSKSCRKWC